MSDPIAVDAKPVDEIHHRQDYKALPENHFYSKEDKIVCNWCFGEMVGVRYGVDKNQFLDNGEDDEEQKENSTISCVHNNYEVRLINTQNSECILTIIPDYEIVIDKNGYFIVDTENCIDDYIRISEDSFNQRKLTKDEKDNFCKIKNKKVH